MLIALVIARQAKASALDEAKLAISNGDHETALLHLQPLAKDGSGLAQLFLAEIYWGKGGFRDCKQSMMWLRKAIESGIAEAMFNIANRFAHGVCVDRDLSQARHWYQKAAQSDDAFAVEFGHVLSSGVVFTRDNYEAVAWFRIAADRGNLEGAFALARSYFHGEGVARDLSVAASMYLESAERGFVPSMIAISDMFLDGVGVSQDFVSAHKWLNLAVARLPYERFQPQEVAAVFDSSWMSRSELQSANDEYDESYRQLIAARRIQLEAKMTREQIAQAQDLAREWKAR